MFRENASSRLCAVLAGLRLVRRRCGLPEYAAASGGAGKDAFAFCSASGRRSAIVTRTSPCFPQTETGGACHRRKFPEPLSAARSDAPGTRLFIECFSGLGCTEAEQECQQLAFYQERFTLFLQQAQEHARPQLELSHKLGFAAGLAAAILCL